ncbi:hypothetical protein YC2023_058000 [Brassica napus]
MDTPLSFVSPSDESNTVDVDPNIGPIKRGRRRCNGMSYDTGEVDEDGNMIFRGKSLKGFAYVVQDSVVDLLRRDPVQMHCLHTLKAGTVNKGFKKRAWDGKIYVNWKLFLWRWTIWLLRPIRVLLYVSLRCVLGKASLSSSDPTGLDSVRDEPEEGMEDQDEFFIEDFDAAAFVRHDIFVKTPQILRAICFMQLVRGLGSSDHSRIREKEYEQLAIWFGDANMGVDVTNSKKHATTYPDPKTQSQTCHLHQTIETPSMQA